MNKTLALFAIAGLSMTSEINGVQDDNLQILESQKAIKRPVFTAFHTVDDELRVLPIDYHPPRPSPSKPIWTDDELRVLPTDPIFTVLHTVDDELRVLPIDYHPPRPAPSRPISADDELRTLSTDAIFTALHTVDDELRVLPIDYHPPRPAPSRPISADDELRVLPIDYRPSSGSRPGIYYTDDELITINDGVYHGGGRFVLANSPNRPQPRPSNRMMADDEFRTIPSLYSHISQKYAPQQATEEISHDDEYFLDSRMISVGAGSLTRPKKETVETSKPVHAGQQEARMISVGAGSLTRPKRETVEVGGLTRPKKETIEAGSLTRPKKETVETSKPVLADQQEARMISVGAGGLTRPKKDTIETVKPTATKNTNDLRIQAADDEFGLLSHFLPKKHHKKDTTQTPQPTQGEVASSEAADNSLVELTHMLRDVKRRDFLAY